MVTKINFDHQLLLPFEGDENFSANKRTITRVKKSNDRFWIPAEEKRKKPTVKHRITPCVWCGFPLSQRHHCLPFSKYGETATTVQLCGNCHEIYHAVYDVLIKDTEAARMKYIALCMGIGANDFRIQRSREIVSAVKDIMEQANGFRSESSD